MSGFGFLHLKDHFQLQGPLILSRGQFQNRNCNNILSKDNMVETCRYAPLEGSCGHFAAYVLGSGNYYIFKTIHTFVYFRNGIREHYQFQLHE